jgi:hypothetical protein
MEQNEIPFNKINKFLSNHSFVIEDLRFRGKITVKYELTGIRNLRRIGEWTEHIGYTLYLESADSKLLEFLIINIFSNMGGNETEYKTADTELFFITNGADLALRNFLKYWGITNYVICTKIVNNIREN